VNGADLERSDRCTQPMPARSRRHSWSKPSMARHRSVAAFRQVVAVSRWKGHLRVMIRGWPRWYPVESVRIECAGAALLQEGTRLSPPVLPVHMSVG